jgi:DNA-binding transcriptional LysR family regulator
MTLQQLEYFRVMAKVLHYTKAAEMLYISQPSLSYAISELEKELAIPLFKKMVKKPYSANMAHNI